MNRNELVTWAKALLSEAAEGIALWLENHSGEARDPLCKEIDPEGWEALSKRVMRRQKKLQTAKEEGSQTTTSHWTEAPQHRRTTKAVLREKPEIVAELDPAEQRELAKALDTEAAKREHAKKQVAKAKEREHLGDEVVDDLELKEELQSTEYLLVTARGNLRGFVKRAGEIGVENTPEAWRESCIDWIEDLKGHLGMAEALLAGDSIDWTAFEDMLEKEAN